MRDMPRPRPPHLHHERTRHGTLVWYVRVGKGARIRIRAGYGTPEFDAEYQAAIAGAPAQPKPRGAAGSLEWLIDRYRDSGAWSSLAAATRRKYDLIFAGLTATSGTRPYAEISRADIVATRDKRRGTPFQANNTLKALAGLFRWAVEAELMRDNPVVGVRRMPTKTEGFRPWTAEDCAAFEAYWSLGTRERLAYAILRYSGLRRGDAAKLGRQHIRDGVLRVTTGKTGAAIALPVHPRLQAAIDATPLTGMTFIPPARGTNRPMTDAGFGNWFSKAAREAGVSKSAHGLRKTLATDLAERGGSERELDAAFGWTDGGTTSRLYTRAADRARLAAQGMAKLTETGTSIPAPRERVRAKIRNS